MMEYTVTMRRMGKRVGLATTTMFAILQKHILLVRLIAREEQLPVPQDGIETIQQVLPTHGVLKMARRVRI
jgi:hypothetical protein